MSPKKTVATNTAMYIPNLINYLRLIILLLMLLSMRKRPISSFILCILSGLLDMFDGDIARYYSQTSKLGYLLDMGMDRLTNTAQMFLLASIYPKYCICFFIVAYTELLRDFSGSVLNSVSLGSSLAMFLSKENDLEKIKRNVFEQTGYRAMKSASIIKDQLNATLPQKFLSSVYSMSFRQMTSFNTDMLYMHYVWYSSDLFYWVIYMASFFVSSSQTLQSENLPTSSNTFARRNYLKIFLVEFIALFDNLSDFVAFHCQLTSVVQRRNLRLMFRFLGFACLIGAVLKFYYNFITLIDTISRLVEVDNKWNNFNALSS